MNIRVIHIEDGDWAMEFDWKPCPDVKISWRKDEPYCYTKDELFRVADNSVIADHQSFRRSLFDFNGNVVKLWSHSNDGRGDEDSTEVEIPRDQFVEALHKVDFDGCNFRKS